MCEEANVLLETAGLLLALVILDMDHYPVAVDGDRPSALRISQGHLIELALPDGLIATVVDEDAVARVALAQWLRMRRPRSPSTCNLGRIDCPEKERDDTYFPATR